MENSITDISIYAEKFWSGGFEKKQSAFREMLTNREYVRIYSLVMSARAIDSTVVKSYGDIFFDKFVALITDIKIADIEIMPFIVHVLTSFDATSGWKEYAAAYLAHLCKDNFDGIAEYATAHPSTTVWRALVAAYPEKATDIMLELLIEKKGKGKTVLREVLSETKLDVVPLLAEEYGAAPLGVKIGIVRLLVMFKKDAEATRALSRIRRIEKSLTVRRIIDGVANGLDFSCAVSLSDNAFVATDGDKRCVFLLEDSGIQMFANTDSDITVARKAIKERKSFLKNSFYTGEGIELYSLAEAVAHDPLFAYMCNKCLFAAYNAAGNPVKLFTFKNSEVFGINTEIESDSEELASVAHPAELADSALHLPTDGFDKQMKRDCFLPGKEELRLSGIPAFAGAVIDLDLALARAAKKNYKVTVGESINYFTVRFGNYYCVNTFGVIKNTATLGNAAFYNYDRMAVTGNNVSLVGAIPLTVENIPVRIFSEFLAGIYYIMRGEKN